MSIRMGNVPRSASCVALGLAAIVLSQTRTVHANSPVSPKKRANAATPCSNLNSEKGGAPNDNLRNFRTALNEISQESHVLIIAEGAPLVQDLSDAKLAELRKSILAASDQSGGKLSCVASEFDYDVVRFDDRTFLLLKRYRNSYELPLVMYEELAHSIRSILYLYDSYSPAPPQFGPTATNAFYDSLTPEQKQQAKIGISVGKLDEAQRRLAAAAIERILLETRIGGLRQLSGVLTAFPQAKCSFQWVDASIAMNTTVKAFGYAGNVGVRGSNLVFPLSTPFECLGVGGYTGFRLRPIRSALAGDEKHASDPDSERDPVAEKVGGEFTIDPTVPNRLDRILAASSELASSADGTLTLRRAAQCVLDPTPAPSSPPDTNATPISVNVNDAISEKPVNVFGLAYKGDGHHFLKALAQVYGLQLSGDLHNNYEINLPQPHMPGSPQDLPAEIVRLTPPPVLSALAGRASAIIAEQSVAQDAARQAPTTDANGRQLPGMAEYNQRRITNNARLDAVESLYFSAARRLIAAAEPLVPTASSPPVSVSVLAPESNRLIGLAMFCQAGLIELVGLQRFVPPESLLAPDSAIVQASMFPSSDGEEDLGISFGHLREDGTLVSDGGARAFHSHRAATVSP